MIQKSFEAARTTTVSVVSRKELSRHTQILVDLVARRAYELYGIRGYAAGGDLDDWMYAESELLTTLKLGICDTGEYVIARADISGLGPHDIKVCVEPTILRIVGTPKKASGAIANSPESDSMQCKQLLHVAELPNDVDASHAAATATDSTMEIVIPKAARATKGGNHALVA